MDCIDILGIDMCSYCFGFKQMCVCGIYEMLFIVDFYYDDLCFDGVEWQLSKVFVLGFVWMCCDVDDLLFLCCGNIIIMQIGVVVKGVLMD